MIIDKKIDFMGKRNIAVAFSAILLIISLGSLVVKGLNFGLDFTGGTAIELEYAQAPKLEQVRQILIDAGYESAVVVNYGSENEVMVRIQESGAESNSAQSQTLGEKIAEVLKASSDSEITVKQSNFIGPQIGEELRDEGGIGMLLALVVVMFYVAVRFQFKFSVGAVVALAHDVIIVLGIFSLFQFDFDLTVLAAVLAVIGYSLNDTIVVSDRIRENFRGIRETSSEEIINISLTQTLGRTLMTSGTTMIVLLALFFIGGEMIHYFSVALLIGVGIGTYSSIYVAASILLLMKVNAEDLVVHVAQEVEEVYEEIP